MRNAVREVFEYNGRWFREVAQQRFCLSAPQWTFFKARLTSDSSLPVHVGFARCTKLVDQFGPLLNQWTPPSTTLQDLPSQQAVHEHMLGQ